MKRLAPLAVFCALLACSKKTDSSSAPWLTMPDLNVHSARFFPVSPGDVHGPPAGQPLTTCDQCHADRSSGVEPYPPATSFKTFTCTGCHVEIRPGVFHDDIAALATLADHVNQVGFDPTQPLAYDQACLHCHPSGIGVDHALVFPLPHQDSTGTVVAACTDCHVSPTDRTVLGCAACHPHDQAATATAHAAVPEFDATGTTAASALCVRCHGDSTVPVQVAAHASFPIGAGTRHSGSTGGACLTCHPASRAAPKTFAADFSQPSCTGCHVQTSAGFHDDGTALASFHAAAGVTSFQFTTAACLQCHPDGAGGAPPYHPQLFPIDLASKHAGIGCSSCHGPNRADITQLQCASCHADPTKSPNFPTQHPSVNGIAILVVLTPPPPTNCAPSPLPTLQSPDCLMCHALSHVDQVELTHPAGDTAFGHDQHRAAGCFTCHVVQAQVTATVTPPTQAPSGYPAIDFTQPNAARQSSPGCATCHSYGCGNGG